MDFGEILLKAWKIIWKHKILWLFGVLAGCGAAGGGSGGGGGGGTSSIQLPFQQMSGEGLFEPSTQRALNDVIGFFTSIPGWVWLLIGITVVVSIILFSIISLVLSLLLGTLGTTGVIKGTGMADEADLDEKPISFSDIFREIKPFYWKVFLLNLGLRIAGFILGLLLFIPIIILAACTCGLGMLLFIPIGWFIDLLVNFSTIAIVQEEKDIFDGISRGWQVITKNLGNVLLMFLILGVGQFILTVIIGLPLIIVPVPLLVNLFATGFESFAIGLIFSFLLALVIVPLVVFLGGVLRAYVLSSWTLTYRRLTGEGGLQPTVLFNEEDEEERDAS